MKKYDIPAEVQGIRDSIVTDRRALHEMPETGFGLEKTLAYVRDRLEEMVTRRIDEAQTHLARRKDQPFSRQELTLLFAAMLLE